MLIGHPPGALPAAANTTLLQNAILAAAILLSKF